MAVSDAQAFKLMRLIKMQCALFCVEIEELKQSAEFINDGCSDTLGKVPQGMLLKSRTNPPKNGNIGLKPP